MAIDWDGLVLAPLIAAFGEDEGIIYYPQGGQEFDIDGVYDENNRDLDMIGSRVNTSTPVVGARLAQFQRFQISPQQGDQLRIKRTGELFDVKDTDEDGRGHVKLKLNFVGG